VQILAAARQCFIELGPGVSTSVIAERVGLSQAALFKRFGTKKELMWAALKPPEELPWFALVDQGPDDRDIRLQMVEIFEEIAREFEEMMPNIIVLRSCGWTPSDFFDHLEDPVPLVAHRALSGWFRRAVKQGRLRSCDPEVTAMNVLGGLQIRPFLKHISRGKSLVPERSVYVAGLIDALWTGLKPVREP